MVRLKLKPKPTNELATNIVCLGMKKISTRVTLIDIGKKGHKEFYVWKFVCPKKTVLL
jgi:hypothetical protein